MKVVNPTYIETVRVCDYYDCKETKLTEYYNDGGFKLKFCSKHSVNPYGEISDIIPIFDKENYSTHNILGLRLCNYVGCKESTNLICLHNAHWCNSHGRIIMSLRLGILGRSNKTSTFMSKLKEFSYRKIFDPELDKDISLLEKELALDTNAYSGLIVNMVHYNYAYTNYIFIKNKEENCSFFKKSNKEYFDDLYKGKNRFIMYKTKF